ncbi:MAG: hypothetical protein WCK70_03270 [Chloroflexales bacterium]|jgi:hypothetical protein
MRAFIRTLQSWFSPGTVVAATSVAVIWLHNLRMSALGHEFALIITTCLAFGLLWATNEQP